MTSTNFLDFFVFFYKFVNEIFWNLLFWGKIANKQIKLLKIYMFHYKIGLINIQSISKVMENQNFSCIYLRTMILHLTTYSKMSIVESKA